MANPGTRFFIGPLTPAQQRRRQRNRESFRRVVNLADTWKLSVREAFNFDPLKTISYVYRSRYRDI